MEPLPPHKHPKIVALLLSVGFALLLVFYFFLFRAPLSFPEDALFHIEKNTGLTQIARNLKNQDIIRSTTLLKIIVVLTSKKHRVVEGDYYFKNPLNVFQVAQRITKGQYGMLPIKVTFREGLNSREMADILVEKIPGFNKAEFLALAAEKEGYLFPDTYFFFQNVTPERVVESMTLNFEDKIESLKDLFVTSKRPLPDIINMASIIEEEANSDESRVMISGILWKRLQLGLPLQVDSSFVYIMNKKSSELSLDDLSFDSPYNTYKYAGLPKGPISNPGIKAIEAALAPKESDYLYFLSDSKGATYYAKTLEEHVKNKNQYLRK